MQITLRTVQKLSLTTGEVCLNQKLEEVLQGEEVSHYSVVVTQYDETLENIREILSLTSALETFSCMCEKYKEQLNQGRPCIKLQLAEREDGLWEFQSDVYTERSGALRFIFKRNEQGFVRRTYPTKEAAINFARIYPNDAWWVTIEGAYDVVDKTGHNIKASSLLGQTDREQGSRKPRSENVS